MLLAQVLQSLRKNTLAKSLLPAGKLGKLVFTPPDSVKTIVIDAALIGEVQLLAQGGADQEASPETAIIAENWLYRLRLGSADNTVIALAYGNPDEKLLKEIAPSELNFYREYAREKLEKFLGRSVKTQNGWGDDVHTIKFTRSDYSQLVKGYVGKVNGRWVKVIPSALPVVGSVCEWGNDEK